MPGATVGISSAPAIKIILVLTRIVIVLTGAACCIGVPFLLAGYKDEASQVPPQWDLDYRDRSIRQIVDQLGPPQDNASAKQFMNWVLPGPDGTRVLKVICPLDCSDSERPADVIYLFFREIGKAPVRSKDLLKAQPAITASRPQPGLALPSAAR